MTARHVILPFIVVLGVGLALLRLLDENVEAGISLGPEDAPMAVGEREADEARARRSAPPNPSPSETTSTRPAPRPVFTEETGRLDFQFIDEKGEPAAGLRVRLCPVYDDSRSLATPAEGLAIPAPSPGDRVSRSDGKGRLTATNLPRRPFLLIAERGESFAHWCGLPDPSGQEPRIHRVFLEPGRRIELIVRDQEGQPIENCLVGVCPDWMRPLPYMIAGEGGEVFPHERTDASGRVVFVATHDTARTGLAEASVIHAFIPRFGGRLIQRRLVIEGARFAAEIRTPRPVVGIIRSDADNPRPILVTLRSSVIEPTNSAGAFFPLEGLREGSFADVTHRLGNWNLSVPATGLKLANFRAKGGFTAETGHRNYSGSERRVPEGRSEFPIDCSAPTRAPAPATTGKKEEPSELREGEAAVTFFIRDETGDAHALPGKSALRIRSKRGFRLVFRVLATGPEEAVKIALPAGKRGEIRIYDPFRSLPRKGVTNRNYVRRTMSFGALTPGATLTLGEVRFTRPPLIVAGRVRDSEGVPVPDLWLMVRALGESKDGDRRVFFGSATTDSRGNFELRSHDLDRNLRNVWVGSTDDGRRKPMVKSVEVAVGSDAVELTARAPGFLRGRLVVGDHRVLRDVTLDLMTASGHGLGTITPRATGLFESRPLGDGEYRVSLRADNIFRTADRPAVTFRIVNGELRAPAALKHWRVLEDLVVRDVRVVDEAGTPQTRVRVSVWPTHGTLLEGCISRTNGKGLASFTVRPGERYDIATYISQKRLENVALPCEVRVERTEDESNASER